MPGTGIGANVPGAAGTIGPLYGGAGTWARGALGGVTTGGTPGMPWGTAAAWPGSVARCCAWRIGGMVLGAMLCGGQLLSPGCFGEPYGPEPSSGGVLAASRSMPP